MSDPSDPGQGDSEPTDPPPPLPSMQRRGPIVVSPQQPVRPVAAQLIISRNRDGTVEGASAGSLSGAGVRGARVLADGAAASDSLSGPDRVARGLADGAAATDSLNGPPPSAAAVAYIYENVVEGDPALTAAAPAVRGFVGALDQVLRTELLRIAAEVIDTVAAAPSLEEAARRLHELVQAGDLGVIPQLAEDGPSVDRAAVDAILDAATAAPRRLPGDEAVERAGGRDNWIGVTVFLLIAFLAGAWGGIALAHGDPSNVIQALLAFLFAIKG